jgi:O-antigen ligase
MDASWTVLAPSDSLLSLLTLICGGRTRRAGSRQVPNPMPKTRPIGNLPDPPSDAEPMLDRVAGWSFLLFVAVQPWSIAAMSISVGICAALTLAVWARRPGRLPVTPVAWPTLAWFAAFALSAWFALDRTASLPRLTKMLFPLLVPLAATHARLPQRGRRALATMLVSATLAALFGLYMAKGVGWPARTNGAVGHYMTFGGQLLLFVSLAAGVLVLERAPRWRLGALFAALAGSAALATTFTRSAWIGLILSLATLLGLARPRWLPVLATAVMIALVLAPASYRARALSAFDPHNSANLERTYMWQGGLAMFRDHPLTGVGLQDLQPLYERYKSPQATERAGHMHSVPVQIAASMGLVGLIAFVLLYGSLFVAAGSGLRQMIAAGGLAAGLRAGVVAMLVGFLVAGLFEWNFGDEELLYPLLTLVGMAWAARGWGDGKTGGSSPDATHAAAAVASATSHGPR